MLADEVGLGKTVEACMVLREYIQRGMVKNALILPSTPLVSQWQKELRSKIGRIHRIGQTKEVMIYNFCGQGSMEEHILDLDDFFLREKEYGAARKNLSRFCPCNFLHHRTIQSKLQDILHQQSYYAKIESR